MLSSRHAISYTRGSISKYPSQARSQSPAKVETIVRTGRLMLERGRSQQRAEQARRARGEEPDWRLKAVSSAEELRRNEERERAEAARAAKAQALSARIGALRAAIKDDEKKQSHGRGIEEGTRMASEGKSTDRVSAELKESSTSDDDFNEVKRNIGQSNSPRNGQTLHRRAAQPVFEKGFLDRAKKPETSREGQGQGSAVEGERPPESPSTPRLNEPAQPHAEGSTTHHEHQFDSLEKAFHDPAKPAEGSEESRSRERTHPGTPTTERTSPRPEHQSRAPPHTPSSAHEETVRRQAARDIARHLHGMTEAAFQRHLRNPLVRNALQHEMDQWYDENINRPGADRQFVVHHHAMGVHDLTLGRLAERLGPGVTMGKPEELARMDREAGKSPARDRGLEAAVERLLPQAQPPAQHGARASEGRGVGSETSSQSSSPRIGTTVHRDPSV